MVTITCPWCEEDLALLIADVVDLETSIRCVACGTTVDLVEEPTVLDVAA